VNRDKSPIYGFFNEPNSDVISTELYCSISGTSRLCSALFGQISGSAAGDRHDEQELERRFITSAMPFWPPLLQRLDMASRN
jgi:hypothetical protein